MALTGVKIKGHGRNAKDPVSVTKAEVNKAAKQEIAELKESNVVLSDSIQAYVDFCEQFQEILNKDGDGIEEMCDVLEIAVKGNTPQRDMLASIFDKMLVTMVGEDAT